MPPLAIAGGIADQMGAIMLAYGVLAALLARERYGVGQEVDASHLGSMTWLQGLSVVGAPDVGLRHPAHAAQVPGESALEPLPLRRRHAGSASACCSPTATGPTSAAPSAGPSWPPTSASPTCACAPPTPARRSRSSTRSSPASRAPSGCASCAPAATSSSARSTPSTTCPTIRRCRRTTTSSTSSTRATARRRWSASRCACSETPGSIRLPAPEFGQHTEEILTELLGYTWEQVGALRENDVI